MSRLKRGFFILALAVIFLFGLTPEAFYAEAFHAGSVEDHVIEKREEGLDMSGVVPSIPESQGEAAGRVNERIERTVNGMIASAKDIKARSISFEYEIYSYDRVVSIVIHSTVTSASSKTEVVSVNFNPDDGRAVTINDAVGYDIAPLVEKLLIERIRRNPETYNTSSDRLSQDQAFYLDGGRLVLLFAEGVSSLEIELGNIARIVMPAPDYLVKPGYRVKMIPLREVCEALGYEVDWEEEDANVYINYNGSPYMTLTLNENNYLVPDKKVRSLETAPELEGGVVYVPISFFDQILNLVTYSVNAREDITFLSYME
jgi:hypothetical protein